MKRTSQLLRVNTVALLLIVAFSVACVGGGSGKSSPDLTVSASTIFSDTAGVLPPAGDGSLSVDDLGAAHDHIPILVPPGRAGIQPELSLGYSSGGGNGLTGVGWGLGGLSRITRCPSLRKNGNVAAPLRFFSFHLFNIFIFIG